MSISSIKKAELAIFDQDLSLRGVGSIHSSVHHRLAGPVITIHAEARAGGTLRYLCPTRGSLVLLTDESSLTRLSYPTGRLRCTACGEMHLVSQDS